MAGHSLRFINMTTEEKLLSQLAKIPYATVYNFQPWTAKTTDLLNSLQWPDKILRRLYKNKIVDRMPLYPEEEVKRNYREHTFYTVRGERKKGTLGFLGNLSLSNVRHESGLMDILLAFINLYPDYEIEIDTTPEMPYTRTYNDSRAIKREFKKTYCPDAIIRMTSPEGREYNFIIEFERTKTHQQIRSEKFNTIPLLNRFHTYGLNKYTKFLFVYSYEFYNIYTRPSEYNRPEVQKHHQAIEGRLKTLIKTSRDYDYLTQDIYYFLPFYDFYRLDKGVWLDRMARPVSLIPKS